jgi:hypothetical protein
VINKITMTIEIAGKDPVAYAVKVNAALMNLDAGAPAVVKVSEPVPVPTPDIPAQLPGAPTPAAFSEATAPEKRGRGRPRKEPAAPATTAEAPAGSEATKKSEIPTPAPVAAAATAPPVATATQQEAQDALARLFEKAGLQTSLDLLTRHGVKRVSDLKPETRAAFIVEAGQWTEAGGDPQATIAAAV